MCDRLTDSQRERIEALTTLLAYPDLPSDHRGHVVRLDGYPRRQEGWRRWLPIAYHQYQLLARSPQ